MNPPYSAVILVADDAAQSGQDGVHHLRLDREDDKLRRHRLVDVAGIGASDRTQCRCARAQCLVGLDDGDFVWLQTP